MLWKLRVKQLNDPASPSKEIHCNTNETLGKRVIPVDTIGIHCLYSTEIYFNPHLRNIVIIGHQLVKAD